MHSHEGTDTPEGSNVVQVLLSSFRSHVVKVKVAKQPGKQDLDLLEDDDVPGKQGSIWNTIAK